MKAKKNACFDPNFWNIHKIYFSLVLKDYK